MKYEITVQLKFCHEDIVKAFPESFVREAAETNLYEFLELYSPSMQPFEEVMLSRLTCEVKNIRQLEDKSETGG